MENKLIETNEKLLMTRATLYDTDLQIANKLHTSETFQNAIDNGIRLGRENSPDFYEFCSQVIEEAYGKLGYKDFNSNSHAAPWFARRQNLIEKMLETYYKKRKK